MTRTWLTKQNKDSFLQLLFLIDPVTKEMKFSNQSLGFENTIHPSGIPFLKFADNAESAEVLIEWEKCLLLKPGQNRHFGCRVKSDNGETVRVVLHAIGVQMTGDPAHYILFTAEQADKNADEWKKSFEQLNASFNTFKKEYTGFIDIASHDLDAPLRKLTTFINKLTNKLTTGSHYDEIQEYIIRIEACLKDMRSLIDDLSMLSYIISKTSTYTACNIETLIQKLISGMQPAIKEKKAVITLSALPVIEGDIEQFTQLFKNLIENAITFSKKDLAPVIKIQSSELTTEEKNHFGLQDPVRYFKMEISDNGIGFKQEYREKIFQPFQRLNGKSQFPGNGIGLAVCKKIIDNHKGIIYAEGAENSGACFVLILPQTTPQTW